MWNFRRIYLLSILMAAFLLLLLLHAIVFVHIMFHVPPIIRLEWGFVTRTINFTGLLNLVAWHYCSLPKCDRLHYQLLMALRHPIRAIKDGNNLLCDYSDEPKEMCKLSRKMKRVIAIQRLLHFKADKWSKPHADLEINNECLLENLEFSALM